MSLISRDHKHNNLNDCHGVSKLMLIDCKIQAMPATGVQLKSNCIYEALWMLLMYQNYSNVNFYVALYNVFKILVM